MHFVASKQYTKSFSVELHERKKVSFYLQAKSYSVCQKTKITLFSFSSSSSYGYKTENSYIDKQVTT